MSGGTGSGNGKWRRAAVVGAGVADGGCPVMFYLGKLNMGFSAI